MPSRRHPPIQDGEAPCRFVLHDRDAEFPASFDAIVRHEGTEMVPPPRCPQEHGVAERWIGSVRQAYLDHLLILGARQLHRTLPAYIRFYSQMRPHQVLGPALASPSLTRYGP
jgi:hypothetical protein